MANEIKKKFIGNDQVDGSKILLENEQFVRVKKQDGSVKNLFKLDASDKFILSDAPLIQTESTDAKAAQTKGQLDTAVAAEASLRQAADGVLQGNINSVQTALTQEVSDRAAADAVLQGKINDEATARAAADALLIPLSQKGAVNGVAPLDGNQLIPSQYLPGYVDDVLEFANVAAFPVTGESGKIYVALDSLRTYRWGGSAYAEVSPSAVVTVNGKAGAVVLTTDDVNEGAVNKYFTDARAQAATDSRFTTVEGRVTTLEQKVQTLEAKVPAWTKMKVALTSTDIGHGYIDAGHVVVPGSLTVTVGRLVIHEGASEDFTVSTVNGKSRITFLNDLVSPGLQALDVGDQIYLKYQY